jgi:DNA-binding MarR family transcriptional regulator
MPPKPRRDAADALIAAAPLASRWIQRLLAEHDPPLTVAQFLALRAIAAGPVAGADLARRTGVSAAAVSQLVAELEDAGLVTRTVSGDDRRRLELALTRAGASTLGAAHAALRDRIAELLDGLPPHEAHGLADGLERVAALLAGTPPPRPKHPPPHRR